MVGTGLLHLPMQEYALRHYRLGDSAPQSIIDDVGLLTTGEFLPIYYSINAFLKYCAENGSSET